MEPDCSQLSARQKAFLAAIVAVTACIPFLQCIGFEFLLAWDDLTLFKHESMLRFNSESILYWLSGGCFSQIFLVPFLTFMLDYAIAGLNPALFHAHSLLWHAAACVGVFYCFTLFRIRPWLALLFAVAYAVHPQKAESVAWVMERRDMIFGAFTAWSFYFYVKAGTGRRFMALPLTLFALALLSKPTAVAFPAALCAFELSRLRWDSWRVAAIRLAPFLLLAACFAAYNSSLVVLDEVHKQKPLALQLSSALHNYPWYFTSFLAPWDLLPIYPYAPSTLEGLLPSICLWLGLFALLAFLYFRAREFLLRGFVPVWLAFGAALTPTIGFVKYSGFDYADRYNYMPSAYLCFAGAWLFSRLLDWADAMPLERRSLLLEKTLKAGLGLWVGVLFLLAFLHAPAYASSLSLFAASSLSDKPNMVALNLLAMEKFAQGAPAADELYANLERVGIIDKLKQSKTAFYSDSLDIYVFLRAVETMRANPATIKDNLPILVELSKGKIAPASRLDRFTILKTCFAFQIDAGMRDEAIQSLERINAYFDSQPANQRARSDVLAIQGLSLLMRSDYDKAIACLSEVVRLRPESAEFKANLLRAISMRDAAKAKAFASPGVSSAPAPAAPAK